LKNKLFRTIIYNPDERPSNGLSEAMMKIKRAQGFHPRRVKFDFHTNPDERPSNGLSEASMKISQAPELAQNGRSDIFILTPMKGPQTAFQRQ